MGSTAAAARLRSFAEANSLKTADLAKRLGCSQPHASRLLNGAMPSVRLAFRIQRATKNHVKASDWAEEAEEASQ
jgi:transcriptional regulator with XRE-family HTH domain